MAEVCFTGNGPVGASDYVKTPRLLLHCCCAPCASSVLEQLSANYRITAFFFNPNITPYEEHNRRLGEFDKLPLQEGYKNPVDIVTCSYDPKPFIDAAASLWDEPEDGERCRACFQLRLGETAKHASVGGFDCFATTLSVSPHKDAAVINETGGDLEREYGIRYLHSDFKKRDGYKRSIELSKQYDLYRQSYCGCKPSKKSNIVRSNGHQV